MEDFEEVEGCFCVPSWMSGGRRSQYHNKLFNNCVVEKKEDGIYYVRVVKNNRSASTNSCLSPNRDPGALTNSSYLTKIFSDFLYNLQKLEEDQYNLKALYCKQLHMRQMMNLKTKGRFLEETKIFDSTVGALPQVKS